MNVASGNGAAGVADGKDSHARDARAGDATPRDAPAGDADAVARHVRAQGGTVVVAGGCFDLLHAGHVSLLESARRLGDCLIVAMNSDASVRRLKGASRPVQPEAARAAVLASVAAVDLVVIFEEDTPLALLDAIRPDVLVKGSDYTHDTVVGAKEVESWGGRVMLADIKPGHSTTATVMRLRG